MAARSSATPARPPGSPSAPALHLRGASFSHSSAVDVLTDVDLDLGPGAYGLVGANGVGKTTLLDLLDGTSAPTSGDVTVHAIGPVVRVHQRLGDEPPPAVATLATRWDGEAVAWRRRFDLDVDDLYRWSTRSPGTRMRWAVASALDARPDVLLLDEPTNHLAARARDRLVSALLDADVPLLVLVSHDRHVLDRLTDTTLRLVDGDLGRWSGGWTEAHDRWIAHDAARRAAHDRARRDARRAERLVGEARRDLRGVERGAAATRRDAGPDDPDARGALATHHAATAAKSLAGRVAARRSAADRAHEAVAETAVRRRRGAPIDVEAAVSARDLLVHLRCAELCAGDHPVARDVDLAVGPTDRIHVAGANGAGKSTLLHALVDASAVDVGMLDQEVATTTVARDRLLAVPDRHRVLAIMDHLGVDPDRLLASEGLTPGEARKLALADLVVRPRPLLVLDEPTNHLDVESIQRLQEALVDHPAAIVLVTHDAALAAAVATTTWRVGDGWVEVEASVGS